MQLVQDGYGSSSEDEAATMPARKVDAAPMVSADTVAQYHFLSKTSGAGEIAHNVPYAVLSAPEAGPQNPFSTNRHVQKNILTGHVEEHVMSDKVFENMQRTFRREKYTMNPDGSGSLIGDLDRARDNAGLLAGEPGKKRKRVKREAKGRADDVDGFLGPWAKYQDHERLKNPEEDDAIEIEPIKPLIRSNDPQTEKRPFDDTGVAADDNTNEETIFHGVAEHDYQGRSYMHIPNDLDVDIRGEPGRKECFLPKRCIHTWSGHTKGVNAIEFLPRSGHLLLSASLDCTVKLWDVYHDRSVLRSFMGHSKAVKDISFNHDGSKFVSAGFDKWLKVWDTETGKCTQTFTVKKLPQCIRFNPDPEYADSFLAGCSDKSIYQYDARSGEMVKRYSQHVGAVNSITFNGDRFISTSDDKTVRVWEFGIPQVIKYISDPEMSSMPSVALSPNKKWLACQALDNQLMIYSASEKYKLNRNKQFTGHLVAGYACQPSWSSDSRFLTCGDSQGQVWFWDFKRGNMVKKLSGHTGVVIGSQWHPQEQSKVATCGWDGLIKFWD